MARFPVAPFSFARSLSSSLHYPLFQRNYRGLSLVLPATVCAAHASLARRSLLRQRAADCDRLRRFSRTLARDTSARLTASLRGRVLRVRARRRWLKRRCSSGRDGRLAALDDERRRAGTHGAACAEAERKETRACNQRQDDSRSVKARRAIRAEAAACPQTPARTRDALATFRTKVWLVHPASLR